ncbi:hypothetical protein [Myxococcus phage Mx1]|nr:hypothetical protein [Myxococcus phage Mx1]
MSTQEEVQVKKQFVRDILKTNKFESPSRIVESLQKKFGSALARNEIAEIRAEYGVKLGPGGTATDLSGNRLDFSKESVSSVVGKPDVNSLVNQLQAAMRLAGIESFSIPAEGQATATLKVQKMYGGANGQKVA